MSLRDRGLSYLKSGLGESAPSLRLIFWDGEAFDFAQNPKVVLSLNSRRLLRSLLRGDFASLSDAYVSGELRVEGEPKDIISTGVMLAERFEKNSAVGILLRFARLLGRGSSLEQDAANVRRHYDVSNEFYNLWLDKKLVYSCAYFHHETDGIDLAQEQKLDHLCRKLMLKPGDRLLDVGCGWGGLLLWAADQYGALGHGITLSEQQFQEAEARLGGKAKVALTHFQEFRSSVLFDKIVSVGMYEHVGEPALASYFRKMNRLLKPGGLFLNHGIIATGSGYGPSGGDFIERYVFPGGSVAPLSRLVGEMSEAGLEIFDIEDLRPHYVRTLMQWSERLEQNKELAIEAAGPEAYRVYRVYLAGMAYAFDRGWLSVVQVLALKPENDQMPARRPWTRAYQYLS